MRDVAIDDHRQLYRLLHLAHEAPIGMALIHLAARAPMHGDHGDAFSLGAAREFRRVH